MPPALTEYLWPQDLVCKRKLTVFVVTRQIFTECLLCVPGSWGAGKTKSSVWARAWTKTVSFPSLFGLMLTSLCRRLVPGMRSTLNPSPLYFLSAHTPGQIEYTFNNLKQWASVWMRRRAEAGRATTTYHLVWRRGCGSFERVILILNKSLQLAANL